MQVGVEWPVTNRVAGNSEWFVAGRCGCRVFDLPAQVFHPVLQVLLVGANHLQTVKHGACGSRDSSDGSLTSSQTACFLHVTLPVSSKAFLCASQSSSLDTAMPARGNLPCRFDPGREVQLKTTTCLRKPSFIAAAKTNCCNWAMKRITGKYTFIFSCS